MYCGCPIILLLRTCLPLMMLFLFKSGTSNHAISRIESNDIIAFNNMVTSEEVLNRMKLLNGTSKSNAKQMARASRTFLKSMKELLVEAQIYEASTGIWDNYNLQDESKICMHFSD